MPRPCCPGRWNSKRPWSPSSARYSLHTPVSASRTALAGNRVTNRGAFPTCPNITGQCTVLRTVSVVVNWRIMHSTPWGESLSTCCQLTCSSVAGSHVESCEFTTTPVSCTSNVGQTLCSNFKFGPLVGLDDSSSSSCNTTELCRAFFRSQVSSLPADRVISQHAQRTERASCAGLVV